MKTLAIDVGGTKIYNTIVDEKGEIIAEIEKYSTPKTLDEVLALFQKIISKHEKKVDMIAFATAGAVNNENSKVISATGNLPTNYREIEFKSLSTKPVFIENDANCAVYAEYKIGAGKNYSNIVLLTLGTGVGGGIIVNNKLLKGKSGAAGEMHFKMRMDNHRKCTCGAYDCFEAYASGTALKKTAEEMSGNPDITTYDVID
jgi:glucokinase